MVQNYITTFAGIGVDGFKGGPDSLGTFNFPRGCVMDYNNHRMYIVDFNNHAIRIIYVSEITGSNEIYNDNSFNIYPNSTSKEIHINGEKVKSGLVIRVYILSGKIIKEFKGLSDSPIILDISSLDAGIYYLGIENGRQPFAEKKQIVLGK